jgi:glutathione S-transferase
LLTNPTSNKPKPFTTILNKNSKNINMIIYANPMSSNSLKVLYTAAYTNKPFKVRLMNFEAGDHKSDWFTKINPVGKIPAIDDNGFHLSESNAIARYIATNTELISTDTKTQAVENQWIDFINLHVGRAIEKVVWNRVFAPMMNVPVDENSLKEGLEWADKYLPVIDTQLGKAAFVTGDAITLADFMLLSYIGYAEKGNIDISTYTHLTAWFEKVQTMDFYKTVADGTFDLVKV